MRLPASIGNLSKIGSLRIASTSSFLTLGNRTFSSHVMRTWPPLYLSATSASASKSSVSKRPTGTHAPTCGVANIMSTRLCKHRMCARACYSATHDLIVFRCRKLQAQRTYYKHKALPHGKRLQQLCSKLVCTVSWRLQLMNVRATQTHLCVLSAKQLPSCHIARHIAHMRQRARKSWHGAHPAQAFLLLRVHA